MTTTATAVIKPGMSRTQRRRARQQYRLEHPVLSGAVRVVEYVPPKGVYVPVQFAGQTAFNPGINTQ